MAKSDRKGNKRSRQSFRNQKKRLGYYLIVTDTKATERVYFQGLYNSLPGTVKGNQLVIKIVKAKKTEALIDECKTQLNNDPQIRDPWIVFDKDSVPNFDKIIDQAERQGISVGWSNPCVEIWFEAYYGKMNTYISPKNCCRGFANTFQRKTNREYDKSDEKIYTFLVETGDEEQAIQIAKQRHQAYIDNEIKPPSEMNPCTTLYKLVKEIHQKAQSN